MARTKREGYPSNKRQQDFMVYHVVEKIHQIEAAIKAGYSKLYAKKRATTLYNSMLPYAAELQDHKSEFVAERLDVTIDRIADELACIGFVNPKDYINVRNIAGDLYIFGKPINELTDTQARAIQSWSVEEVEISKKKYQDYRYIFYDKRGALRDMGQHLGMYTERMILEARVTQVETINLKGVPDSELEFWMERMKAHERGEELPPIDVEFHEKAEQLGLPSS